MGADSAQDIEARLAGQVQALEERLEALRTKRKAIEQRVHRLRGQLRVEDARLEQEKEREAALETAFRMAVLAKNLAAGGLVGQREVAALLEADATDWPALTIAEACRRILAANIEQPLSNRELREALLAKGKDVPVASIATTLERYPDTFRKGRRGNTTYWQLSGDPEDGDLTPQRSS